ncbi:putative bifunctional diguanylate cyclase/phosphodiesterase [Alkalibacterium putridalgicola]|uniref:putative bifunctional diguanylate cyclase/phosphodiesterase n=1 Tax=Alkalibacterium putridalgicola TaxID=426703 RepID=UPI0034CD842F
MFKRGRFIIGIMGINIIIFYGWLVFSGGNSWLLAVGVNLQHIAGLIFGNVFTFRAFKRIKNKERKFWSILNVGLFTYLVANLFWLFFLIDDVRTVFSESAYSLWLAAYILILSSLIYWIRWAKPNAFKGVYLFNIIIFMITAASISLHFLIEPIITLSGASVWNTAVMLAYPVVDLSLLFLASIIYYLIHKDRDKSVMLLIVSGVFLHTMADSYSVYSGALESYSRGGVSDFLWLMSIWLIGLAGYYMTAANEKPLKSIEKTYEKLNEVIPYISTVILIVLVSESYNWDFNILSLGLVIIVFMIIGRQLFVIKENNRLIDEYRHLAYHDPLTGLYNRVSFEEHMNSEMKQFDNGNTALLLVDLDRFKVVNDTLGHQAGDYILVKISEYLQHILGPDTQIFRLGGDKFTVVLSNATEEKCIKIAETILEKFQQPLSMFNHEIIVTASMGISMYPTHGETFEELFKYADAAMYLAKEGGKNGYRFYNDDLNQKMSRQMRIESDLRRALEEEQFEVFYQPKVELKTKKIIGMEALLRWQHPELGWISPAEFIPIAEENGQIISIGEWVLKTACLQSKNWQKKGLTPANISVNVSVRQFQQGTILTLVKEALEEAELDPRLLEIEVTESIMQDTKESTEIIRGLRRLGVRISIDDFGTGYSSLNVIKQLPIDTIKLDKTFIEDMASADQQAMVRTIVNLGNDLHLNVVAEGIETEYQLIKLIEARCEYGQGYLFSKAVRAERIEELLNEKTT